MQKDMSKFVSIEAFLFDFFSTNLLGGLEMLIGKIGFFVCFCFYFLYLMKADVLTYSSY